MRAVDLALYADALAAKASVVAARLERARDAVRQAAIERAARKALPRTTTERLERLDVLTQADVRALRADASDLVADLAALEELQAWVEARLAEARESAFPAADVA
jgi:hypothetical protein